MPSYNKVVLVGNVTRDPELRKAGQASVCDLGVAVNERVKKGGDWIEEPTFVDVTLWNKTAEVACEYLTKGAPVLIEGRLRMDQWEQDGKKRSKLKVVGERMQMLGGKSSQSQQPKQQQTQTTEYDDGDVPF